MCKDDNVSDILGSYNLVRLLAGHARSGEETFVLDRA